MQVELVFPNGWGGRRKGSGRKPLGAKAQVPHGRRQTSPGRKPVHITIPLVREFGALKRKGVFEIVRRALLGQSQFASVRSRTPCRAGDALVQEFVVMTDHVHVLVDAADADAVSRAVKSWGGRVAWALRAKRAVQGPGFAPSNPRATRRGESSGRLPRSPAFAGSLHFGPTRGRESPLWITGPRKVFRHRYHARVLCTPSEVKLASDYIRTNYRRHVAKAAVRTGQRQPWFRGGWVDECSTGDATLRALLPAPKCWLLGDEAARLAQGAIDLLARQRDKQRWLNSTRRR